MKYWWNLFGGVFFLVLASAACLTAVEEIPQAEISEVETSAAIVEAVASSTAPPLPTAVPTETLPSATNTLDLASYFFCKLDTN